MINTKFRFGKGKGGIGYIKSTNIRPGGTNYEVKLPYSKSPTMTIAGLEVRSKGYGYSPDRIITDPKFRRQGMQTRLHEMASKRYKLDTPSSSYTLLGRASTQSMINKGFVNFSSADNKRFGFKGFRIK